jgi:hypothetical protein
MDETLHNRVEKSVIDSTEPGIDGDEIILLDIEETILAHMDLGFDPEILLILDNEDARQEDIERIKFKLSNGILVRLFNKANSVVLFGRIKSGDADNFLKVVMRLGMKHAKVYIMAIAMFFLHPELELLAAVSFARAIMGRILASEFGFNNAACDKVELGGLLLEIGKIPFLLYEKATGAGLTEDFITRYHPRLGIKMTEKFRLPEYLPDMITSKTFSFGDRSLSTSAVVKLADYLVGKSFQDHGKLILESPMPATVGDHTFGSIIIDQFQAIGLMKYITVRAPEEEKESPGGDR